MPCSEKSTHTHKKAYKHNPALTHIHIRTQPCAHFKCMALAVGMPAVREWPMKAVENSRIDILLLGCLLASSARIRPAKRMSAL